MTSSPSSCLDTSPAPSSPGSVFVSSCPSTSSSPKVWVNFVEVPLLGLGTTYTPPHNVTDLQPPYQTDRLHHRTTNHLRCAYYLDFTTTTNIKHLPNYPNKLPHYIYSRHYKSIDVGQHKVYLCLVSNYGVGLYPPSTTHPESHLTATVQIFDVSPHLPVVRSRDKNGGPTNRSDTNEEEDDLAGVGGSTQEITDRIEDIPACIEISLPFPILSSNAISCYVSSSYLFPSSPASSFPVSLVSSVISHNGSSSSPSSPLSLSSLSSASSLSSLPSSLKPISLFFSFLGPNGFLISIQCWTVAAPPPAPPPLGEGKRGWREINEVTQGSTAAIDRFIDDCIITKFPFAATTSFSIPPDNSSNLTSYSTSFPCSEDAFRVRVREVAHAQSPGAVSLLPVYTRIARGGVPERCAAILMVGPDEVVATGGGTTPVVATIHGGWGKLMPHIPIHYPKEKQDRGEKENNNVNHNPTNIDNNSSTVPLFTTSYGSAMFEMRWEELEDVRCSTLKRKREQDKTGEEQDNRRDQSHFSSTEMHNSPLVDNLYVPNRSKRQQLAHQTVSSNTDSSSFYESLVEGWKGWCNRWLTTFQRTNPNRKRILPAIVRNWVGTQQVDVAPVVGAAQGDDAVAVVRPARLRAAVSPGVLSVDNVKFCAEDEICVVACAADGRVLERWRRVEYLETVGVEHETGEDKSEDKRDRTRRGQKRWIMESSIHLSLFDNSSAAFNIGGTITSVDVSMDVSTSGHTSCAALPNPPSFIIADVGAHVGILLLGKLNLSDICNGHAFTTLPTSSIPPFAVSDQHVWVWREGWRHDQGSGEEETLEIREKMLCFELPALYEIPMSESATRMDSPKSLSLESPSLSSSSSPPPRRLGLSFGDTEGRGSLRRSSPPPALGRHPPHLTRALRGSMSAVHTTTKHVARWRREECWSFSELKTRCWKGKRFGSVEAALLCHFMNRLYIPGRFSSVSFLRLCLAMEMVCIPPPGGEAVVAARSPDAGHVAQMLCGVAQALAGWNAGARSALGMEEALYSVCEDALAALIYLELVDVYADSSMDSHAPFVWHLPPFILDALHSTTNSGDEVHSSTGEESQKDSRCTDTMNNTVCSSVLSTPFPFDGKSVLSYRCQPRIAVSSVLFPSLLSICAYVWPVRGMRLLPRRYLGFWCAGAACRAPDPVQRFASPPPTAIPSVSPHFPALIIRSGVNPAAARAAYSRAPSLPLRVRAAHNGFVLSDIWWRILGGDGEVGSCPLVLRHNHLSIVRPVCSRWEQYEATIEVAAAGDEEHAQDADDNEGTLLHTLTNLSNEPLWRCYLASYFASFPAAGWNAPPPAVVRSLVRCCFLGRGTALEEPSSESVGNAVVDELSVLAQKLNYLFDGKENGSKECEKEGGEDPKDKEESVEECRDDTSSCVSSSCIDIRSFVQLTNDPAVDVDANESVVANPSNSSIGEQEVEAEDSWVAGNEINKSNISTREMDLGRMAEKYPKERLETYRRILPDILDVDNKDFLRTPCIVDQSFSPPPFPPPIWSPCILSVLRSKAVLADARSLRAFVSGMVRVLGALEGDEMQHRGVLKTLRNNCEFMDKYLSVLVEMLSVRKICGVLKWGWPVLLEASLSELTFGCFDFDLEGRGLSAVAPRIPLLRRVHPWMAPRFASSSLVGTPRFGAKESICPGSPSRPVSSLWGEVETVLQDRVRISGETGYTFDKSNPTIIPSSCFLQRWIPRGVLGCSRTQEVPSTRTCPSPVGAPGLLRLQTRPVSNTLEVGGVPHVGAADLRTVIQVATMFGYNRALLRLHNVAASTTCPLRKIPGLLDAVVLHTHACARLHDLNTARGTTREGHDDKHEVGAEVAQLLTEFFKASTVPKFCRGFHNMLPQVLCVWPPELLRSGEQILCGASAVAHSVAYLLYVYFLLAERAGSMLFLPTSSLSTMIPFSSSCSSFHSFFDTITGDGIGPALRSAATRTLALAYARLAALPGAGSRIATVALVDEEEEKDGEYRVEKERRENWIEEKIKEATQFLLGLLFDRFQANGDFRSCLALVGDFGTAAVARIRLLRAFAGAAAGQGRRATPENGRRCGGLITTRNSQDPWVQVLPLLVDFLLGSLPILQFRDLDEIEGEVLNSDGKNTNEAKGSISMFNICDSGSTRDDILTILHDPNTRKARYLHLRDFFFSVLYRTVCCGSPTEPCAAFAYKVLQMYNHEAGDVTAGARLAFVAAAVTHGRLVAPGRGVVAVRKRCDFPEAVVRGIAKFRENMEGVNSTSEQSPHGVEIHTATGNTDGEEDWRYLDSDMCDDGTKRLKQESGQQRVWLMGGNQLLSILYDRLQEARDGLRLVSPRCNTIDLTKKCKLIPSLGMEEGMQNHHDEEVEVSDSLLDAIAEFYAGMKVLLLNDDKFDFNAQWPRLTSIELLTRLASIGCIASSLSVFERCVEAGHASHAAVALLGGIHTYAVSVRDNRMFAREVLRRAGSMFGGNTAHALFGVSGGGDSVGQIVERCWISLYSLIGRLSSATVPKDVLALGVLRDILDKQRKYNIPVHQPLKERLLSSEYHQCDFGPLLRVLLEADEIQDCVDVIHYRLKIGSLRDCAATSCWPSSIPIDLVAQVRQRLEAKCKMGVGREPNAAAVREQMTNELSLRDLDFFLNAYYERACTLTKVREAHAKVDEECL